jgi:hypothetical protein
VHRETEEILKRYAAAKGENYELNRRMENLIYDMGQELLHLPDGAGRSEALTSLQLQYQQLALSAAQDGVGDRVRRMLDDLGRELEDIHEAGWQR